MKWHPAFNALAAAAYIGLVAGFMHGIESIRHDTPDTLLDSIGFISLFVCSAAIMAFLFFYQPVRLLVEDKKSEAVSYFLKTIGVFGLLTVLVLVLVSAQ